MNRNDVSSGSKSLYCALILFTLCGTAISVWNLVNTFQGTLTAMGVLASVIQFLAYVAVLVYVFCTSKIERKGSLPFQGVVFAYAALLGIQLLQSGQSISEYGLSKELTLMINIFNLIGFANAIMFANKLELKKTSIGYLAMAVLLKLIGELIIIVKMWEFINFGIILISLSVPILGLTILFTYLYYFRRISANA